ncbi:MAG: hemerythrin [delta proteobacterium ML8_F1]|nr:MAG: hemerythrin [delta proteobacterium ML8_F1]
MTGIDLMISEHDLIERMLKVMRQASLKLVNSGEINYDDFYAMADFVKVYADEHHHAKEEKILFNRMVEELGETGRVIITHGMLVEHDLGRLHMAELKNALQMHREGTREAVIDVVASAVGYANLLSRHIDKENKMVYTYAQRGLCAQTLAQVDEACEAFEKVQAQKGVQQHYSELVAALEDKYSQ